MAEVVGDQAQEPGGSAACQVQVKTRGCGLHYVSESRDESQVVKTPLAVKNEIKKK